jgi:hypothetical protein
MLFIPVLVVVEMLRGLKENFKTECLASFVQKPALKLARNVRAASYSA